MAYRNKKKLSKKRTFRRKRKSNLVAGVPRSILRTRAGPVQNGMIRKLRYYEQNIQLDPTAGLAGWYYFRANDLYDPNYTGTGHQPMGFDQWMAFYNKFTVLGSKITCTFFNNNTTAVPQDWNCTLRKVTTPTNSTLSDTLEAGGCSHRVMQNDKNVVLSKTYSHRKEHALTVHDGQTAGTASSSPLDEQYFELGIWGINAADNSTIDVVVKIEYTALFYDPKVLSAS